jgi:hypothetical protein
LILNNLILLKISSFCHIDDLARLGGRIALTCSQSYPQLLWAMSDKNSILKTFMRDVPQSCGAAVSVSHNPPQIICLEMCIVFDHTSRRLAYLALGCLFRLGSCAGYRALYQPQNPQNRPSQAA